MANLENLVKRFSADPGLRNWLLLTVDWDILIAEALCGAVQASFTDEYYRNFATSYRDEKEIIKKVRQLFREKPIEKAYSEAYENPLSLALIFCTFFFKCDNFSDMDSSTLLQIVRNCNLFDDIPLKLIKELQKIRNSIMHNKTKHISDIEFRSAVLAAEKLLNVNLIRKYFTVNQKLQNLSEYKHNETELKLKLCAAFEQQCLNMLQASKSEQEMNMKDVVTMLDDLAVIMSNGQLMPRNDEETDFKYLRNIVQQRLNILRKNTEIKNGRQGSAVSQQSRHNVSSAKCNENNLNELRREIEQIKVVLNCNEKKSFNAQLSSEQQTTTKKSLNSGSTSGENKMKLLAEIEFKRKEAEKARSVWRAKLEALDEMKRVFSDLRHELLVATLADDIACCCWKRSNGIKKRCDIERTANETKRELDKLQVEAEEARKIYDTLYAEECMLSDRLHNIVAEECDHGQLTASVNTETRQIAVQPYHGFNSTATMSTSKNLTVVAADVINYSTHGHHNSFQQT